MRRYLGLDIITTIVYGYRNKGGCMSTIDTKVLQREILLGFWKIHILHHAGQGPVVGQWMIQELRHHGYDVSPGTVYPMLSRLEAHGWLASKKDPDGGPRARKEYSLTEAGGDALAFLKIQIEELYQEVAAEQRRSEPRGGA